MEAKIPARFVEKKRGILDSLAVPDEQYTDLSPKGSVDAGIRDLIDEINCIDGIVTTSSCAGRISVFLEGSKGGEQNSSTNDAAINSNERAPHPSGKGMGGRWLFVSHDPVDVPKSSDGRTVVHDMFQLDSVSSTSDRNSPDTEPIRLVRFQFEPMILHIMTASLHHAQPVLSAALNAGFRESGVQSLKTLDDPNAFPMVAVRTAGLGLSSVVGYYSPHCYVDGPEPTGAHPRTLVSEDYLAMMLELGNKRFRANAERIERFRRELRRSLMSTSGAGRSANWEDKHLRAERKRREGLARRAAMKNNMSEDDTAYGTLLDGGNLNVLSCE